MSGLPTTLWFLGALWIWSAYPVTGGWDLLYLIGYFVIGIGIAYLEHENN